MEPLVSNRLRRHLELDRFDTRIDRCLTRAKRVLIATGYVSGDAMAHLARHVREEPESFDSFNLWIGRNGPAAGQQLGAAKVLDEVLSEYEIPGGVRVVKANDLDYHGKVYLFGDTDRLFGGTVGSSNLTAIVDPHRLVEIDLFLEDQDTLAQLERFLTDTLNPSSISITDFIGLVESGELEDRGGRFDFYADFGDDPLDIFEGVSKATGDNLARAKAHRVRHSEFLHRLKTTTAPRSNINAYHGKPRLRRRPDGEEFLVPRPWYEIELIFSADEMMSPNCPPSGDFKVITDDGWLFDCRRQGDPPELGGKNVRSTGTLLILGKWLKGRLEKSGALRTGELVTEEALLEYGRSTISFTKIEDGSGRWYLDFSVPSGSRSA